MTQAEAPEVKFAVLDIETTGLNSQVDIILEVGAILLDKNLNEIARWSCLVNDDSVFAKMNEIRRLAASGDDNAKFIWDMHTRSGLWKDLVSGTVTNTIHDAEDGLFYFFAKRAKPETVTLAGSSIHFDVEFMQTHMPSIPDFFHYRRLDVSGFKVAVDNWAPILKDLRDSELSARKAHRVLADCEDTISELKWYKAAVIAGAEVDA